MDIILIRHTKVAIQTGICYGQSDIELVPDFEAEKEKINKKIGTDKFDAVYSSPLNRCKYLAESLFPYKKVIFDNRLMELNFGQWEGKLWDDIFQTMEGKAFFEDYINRPCPGGESYLDLVKRIFDFYNEIISNHGFDKLAIISHAGPIRAFISLMEGISPQQAFERKIDYGEVCTYIVENLS